MSRGPRVVVAGAGVFGLAVAMALIERGVRVTVLDPERGGASASAVAAGLLAPTSEALFDLEVAPHHALLTAAMRLWPGFAASHGLSLALEGTVVPEAMGGRISALGEPGEPHGRGVLIATEARVADPPSTLRRLRELLLAAGAGIEARVLSGADPAAFDAVVLAAGPGLGEMASLAPEASRLTPVKGQIAVLPSGPARGPTVRWAGGYLAPQGSGARVGATMEVGRDDTRVEPEAIARLLAAAKRVLPELNISGVYGQAGVRMQTPDALPLVGPSRSPRVLLAAGARRNGWLFAPLVGSMIAAYCMGEEPGPWAAKLHPQRFDRTREEV